jgi:hypothetical protein
MTEMSSVTEYEVHGQPGLQLVQGTLAASADTWVGCRFDTITAINATKKSGGSTTVEATWAYSATYKYNTITFTCDAGDVVNVAIWGY